MTDYSGEYLSGRFIALGFAGPHRMGSHIYRRRVIDHPSGRTFPLRVGVIADEIAGAPELGRIRRELRLRSSDLWTAFLDGSLDRPTYEAHLRALPTADLVPPAYSFREAQPASEEEQAPPPRKKKKQKKAGRRRK